MEVGTASHFFAFVTYTPPGQQQAPNPTYFFKWNVETLYYPFRGQQTAKSAYGSAGTGTRKKRMSLCNG
ncbi:MAG: hypothetical protein ACI9VT_002564, partial [Psychroserpens sp.]